MLKITPLRFPNLNYGLLRKISWLKPHILAKKYGLTEYKTEEGRHWYKDNGADILAVAHLDSRYTFDTFNIVKGKPDSIIYCQTLDDRLGAYIILEWLQTANVKFDILLTENEERSASTAADFKPPTGKKYNWTFSFDRRGTDVAVYQYRSAKLVEALTNAGFESVVHGTYSDVVELEFLDVAGINFGAGYYKNHDYWAYASRNDITDQLRRFMQFYKTNRYNAFIIEPEVKVYHTASEENQMKLNFQNQPILLSTKDAKTHKIEVEKSKIQMLRERAEKRKKENESFLKVRELLQSDLSALDDLPAEQAFKLYSLGIMTLGQLVQHSATELINLDGLIFHDIKVLREFLTKAGLSFAMTPGKYGITIPPIVKPKDKEVIKKSLNKLINKIESQVSTVVKDVNRNAGLLLEMDNKDSKVKVGPSEDKVLVQFPLPLKKSEAKLMDDCTRCFNPYPLEELNQDMLCDTCAKIVAKNETDKSAESNYLMCQTCGDVKPKANFTDPEKINICLLCEQETELKDAKQPVSIIFKIEKEQVYTVDKGWATEETKEKTPVKEPLSFKRTAFEEKVEYDKKQAEEFQQLKLKHKTDKDPLAPFEGTLRTKLVDNLIFSLEGLSSKSKKELHFLTTKEFSKVKQVLKAKNMKLLKQVGFPAKP